MTDAKDMVRQDLVKRLRMSRLTHNERAVVLMNEAADMIERQEAEIKRLSAAPAA